MFPKDPRPHKRMAQTTTLVVHVKSVGTVRGSERNDHVGAPASHKTELYGSSRFDYHHSSSLIASSSLLHHHPTPRPPAQDYCERIKDRSTLIATHPVPSHRLSSLFSDLGFSCFSLTSFIPSGLYYCTADAGARRDYHHVYNLSLVEEDHIRSCLFSSESSLFSIPLSRVRLVSISSPDTRVRVEPLYTTRLSHTHARTHTHTLSLGSLF